MSNLVISKENMPTVISYVKEIEQAIKTYEGELKTIKAKILAVMEEENLKTLQDDNFKINRIQSFKKVFDRDKAILEADIDGKLDFYKVESYDDKKLKIDYPHLVSEVANKPYIKITEAK